MKIVFEKAICVGMVILGVLFFSGCASNKVDMVTPDTLTATSLPLPTLAPTVTLVQTATATPTVGTLSASKTPLPTSTFDPYAGRYQRSCATVVANRTSASEPGGLLVIRSHQQNQASYLLDMGSGNKISYGASLAETVSPNGNLLAYRDISAKAVVIIDALGNRRGLIPDADEFLTPSFWLDDQRLFLLKRQGEIDGQFVVPALVLFDLSTMQTEEWQPDYPNLDTLYRAVDWEVTSRFIPSPDLTSVVYRAREGWWSWLILWDIDTKKEIARIYNVELASSPRWSPDGRQIVASVLPQATFENKIYYNIGDGLPYVGGSDLVLIDQSGEIRRLTYFSTNQRAQESQYSWSPDGNKIAFMLKLLKKDQSISDVTPELAVVNLETGMVTNYCFTGFGATWSPDGKYLLINQGFEQGTDWGEVYVVDLENHLAWKVAENGRGTGWMFRP